MKNDNDGSFSDVLILLVEHIDATLACSGARHVPGVTSLTAAKSIAKKWSTQHLRAFRFAACATDFVTKRDISSASGANFDSLHTFFRKLKTRKDGTGGQRIPVIHANGECGEIGLFRDGAECVHRNTGTNELGEKVGGGIRLMLNKRLVPFHQAMDAAIVNKPIVDVVTENAEGIATAASAGTRREVSQRDKSRGEYERLREQRVKGPQLALVPLRTGTDGEA